MKQLSTRHIAYISVVSWSVGDCAKILVMLTVGSPSLFNLFTPIIEELSNRNHEVTTQSYFALKKPIPNVKEMILKPAPFFSDKNFTKNILLNFAKMTPYGEVYTYAKFSEESCEDYIKEETTQELLSAGKQFDLVLTEGASTCSLVISVLFGKHVVGFYGSGNYPWLYSDVPMPMSYVPNYYTPRPSTMDFWQRLLNTLEMASFRLMNEVLMRPVEQKVLSARLPQAPSMWEAEDQVELILTNADPVMYSPRPSMPNVVNCGGLHIKEAKPLPKDLNDFVESSGKDGVIVFALGTNMKSEFLSSECQASILTAFSRLKQKVIWKFEAQLENLPKNVLITKWLPQQDLLAHPKVRLFITHAGLLSLQEAIYHSVPVIGMPFYLDQPGNTGRIKELGIGEHLDFFNITADGFYEIIHKVLTDESYSQNAKKYSAIFRDQPDKPLDRAIFWIEYVLRHGGARHLRPASRDLNLFQYFLIDVIGFLLIVGIVILGITVSAIRLCLRLLFSRKSPNIVRGKKQK